MIKKIFIVYSLLSVALSLNVFARSPLLDEAQKDYLYGDYQTAIEKAQSVQQDDEVLYFLGLTCSKIGEYKRARSYFHKLTKRFPYSPFYEQTLVKVADTYFLAGDYSKAENLYREMEAKGSSFNYLPLVYLRLAQVASKEGRWQEKRKYLNLIKRKYPETCEMRYVDVLSSLGDFFTIQVGAFSKRANASRLKRELEEKGYSAYLIEERKKGYALYKVRIGKYKEKETVERVYLKLLSQGYPARIYP
ncbi:MAG: SPOR domain-containing protein [Candidatus Omnitrophota bacterium]|nr:MAG: SPOR domain-containing protein [Candidatus Omnitrophota bacterium]